MTGVFLLGGGMHHQLQYTWVFFAMSARHVSLTQDFVQIWGGGKGMCYLLFFCHFCY